MNLKKSQTLTDEEYADIHRRIILQKFQSNSTKAEINLTRKAIVTPAEWEAYQRQKELDKQKYAFFHIFLSRPNVEILRLFESYDTAVVSGGNRSTKTTLLCYFILCMVSGYWATAFKKYMTKEGEPIFRPILKRDPENVNIKFQHPAVTWLSCLDRDTQIAPKGVQDTLETMLPQSWIKHTKYLNQVYVHTYYLVDGSKIIFKSAESGANKYQSATIDAIGIDEAHPEEHWRELRSRLGKTIPKTFYGYFPRNGRDWAYKAFFKPNAKIDGDTAVRFLDFRDNPFIPKHVKEKQLARWENDPQREARIRGIASDTRGLVWDNFSRTSNMFDPTEEPDFVANEAKPPSHWYHFMAIDTHNSKKGCAALWGTCAPNGRRYYWHEYQSQGTPSSWADDILRFNFENGIDIEDIFIDPSANSTDASGFNIYEMFEDRLGTALQKATRDRAAGILAVKEGFGFLRDDKGLVVDGRPGILISKFCQETILQIELYTNRTETLGQVKKKDDEFCDNLRYCEITKPSEMATGRTPDNRNGVTEDLFISEGFNITEQSAAMQTI